MDGDTGDDAYYAAKRARYDAGSGGWRREGDTKANKNRPSQMSSKQAVPRLRVAPGLKANTDRSSHDPRFVPAEELNQEGWRNSYEFVFEKQREEAAEAQKALAVSKRIEKKKGHRGGAKAQKKAQKVLAPNEASAIGLELERTRNRLAAEQRKSTENAARAAARKEERAAVKDGKKPFFAKESAVKERVMLARYEELKRSGKLDKFLAKKRKSLSGRGHE